LDPVSARRACGYYEHADFIDRPDVFHTISHDPIDEYVKAVGRAMAERFDRDMIEAAME
jgi:hypothetical protein